MKILFYNWVRFDDDEKRGGGVTVYQKNIIEELSSQGHDIYFVSSGIDYNPFKSNCYYKIVKPNYNVDCTMYSVVNSPVFSPAMFMINKLNVVNEDNSLVLVLKDIINEIGGVDVIHFNNIEGLSLSSLTIKEHFPSSKVLLSIHNYNIFCPQVNLWKNEEKNCDGNNNGLDCVTCVPHHIDSSYILYANYLAYILKSMGFDSNSKVFSFVFGNIKVFRRLLRLYEKLFKKTALSKNITKEHAIQISKEPEHIKFIRNARKLVNKHVDVVLPVSNRVAEICIEKGIDRDKVFTEYIGTKFSSQATYKPNEIDGDHLVFTYLGYMRRDKGFYFFLESLEEMDSSLAGKMNIIIAARFSDLNAVERINNLADKFNSIKLLDGYTHNDLPEILSQTNVGVVPVLWEDNLPQVAIELYSSGCAVLASNLGGPSELSKSAAFRFEAGSKIDFLGKLKDIVNNPTSINDYFEQGIDLTTNEKHVNRLLSHYKL